MRSFYTLPYFAAVATASAIRELTSNDFGSFVAEHELSLIEFVAPWCTYCQELAPAFESAAERLQNEGWPLARVDCDEEKDLCREQNIVIYPTIQVFHGNEIAIYNGDRKADAIVSLMKRFSQPLITILGSPRDVVEFSTKDRVTVVGYFDDEDEVSKKTFTQIAEMYRDIHLFGSITDEMFGRVEDVRKPSIVLYKSFDEGKNLYTEEFDTERIEDFLEEAALPIIGEIGVDLTFKSAALREKPTALIFAEEKEERARLVAELKPIAEVTKGQIVWVTADPVEHAKRASQVALKPGKWPAFAIEDSTNDFKFAFPRQGSIQDLSEKAIQEVVDDFLAGKLVSSVKSEPVPTSQEGPVTSVVADSFEDIITNTDKDVLVLYYSPTCKHCEAMAPTYDELGELLKPYPNLVTVAKIDATSNDVSPSVSSYPVIKLFKSGSKDEPITYKGNRTVDDFVKFVKDNGSRGIAEVLGNVLETKSSHDEL